MTKIIAKVNAVLFTALILGFILLALFPIKAFASCEDGNYGGYGNGEICNKSFDIEKKVRIEGDSKWKDKVTVDDDDEIVEFRVTVENTGEVTVDDMKMQDYLPDEMYRVGGSGLTEYWDDFEPGEEKKFTIKAKVHSDEFDRENFDKCVVNEAVAKYKGHEEASAVATVCYGREEIKELPSTGATANVAIAGTGLGLVALGSVIKKSKRN